MSISRRLALGFALLLSIIAGFVALVHHGQQKAEREFDNIIDVVEPRAAKARLFSRSVFNSALSIRSYLAFPEAAYLQRMDDEVDRARAALAELEADTAGTQDAEMVEPLRGLLDGYLEFGERFIALTLAGESDIQVEREMTLRRERLLTASRTLTAALDARESEHLRGVDRTLKRGVRFAMYAGIVALGLFVALGWLVARSITRPVRRLIGTVEQWQKGDASAALALKAPAGAGVADGGDEMRLMARAFGEAATIIDNRERRMAADARVCVAMTARLDSRTLGAKFLQEVVEHVGAAGGLLYRWNEVDAVLEAIVGHGLSPVEARLASGEGLPGQAARQRATVVVRGIPHDASMTVKLGYDHVQPQCAVAIPIHGGDDLLGVMVVATLHDLDGDAIGFLENSARLLTTGLRNTFAHERIVALLADVRERNAELQEAKEAVQAQSEELQAQNEEIQAQSEELQAQNDQLAGLADGLRQRAAEVAEVDQRKTDFLAVLAHELRNPMAPIVTSLAILRRVCPENGQTATALRAIDRQSAHLTRLIEDLLDITRISRGKIELQKQRTDLVALVEGCIHDYAGAIQAKGVAVEARLPGGPVVADVDADRIVQALNNLLHNAMKFTCAGGRITVAMERAGPEVSLSVSDTGIGIDKELQSQLFVPFSQGPSGLDRRHGGLGLGLALVKGLVEQHGGRIAVHSAGAGTGSRFTMVLPVLADDLASLPAAADDSSAAPADPAPAGSALRVLVVDDNIDAATVLRMALEWEGHAVQVVHDGGEVAQAAREFAPDVVLCDIGLPGIDGYEVARRLRADPATAGVRMIALTGYASPDDRERSRDAGFDDHLAKPVDFERLSQALRHIRPTGGSTS